MAVAPIPWAARPAPGRLLARSARDNPRQGALGLYSSFLELVKRQIGRPRLAGAQNLNIFAIKCRAALKSDALQNRFCYGIIWLFQGFGCSVRAASWNFPQVAPGTSPCGTGEFQPVRAQNGSNPSFLAGFRRPFP
jgi:hypothetical protein